MNGVLTTQRFSGGGGEGEEVRKRGVDRDAVLNRLKILEKPPGRKTCNSCITGHKKKEGLV